MNGTAMNVRERARDVCGQLLVLAFLATVCWVLWSLRSKTEQPAEPFQEDIHSVAADARATAEYAVAYADAEDLTDTGPGAPERMRAARLVAIRLNLAATEAEREAREADEADEKAYEEEMEYEHEPHGP